jgi:hypothetical protein
VPVEMHLYEHGPHGVALAKSYPELSSWTGLLEIWLHKHGWIGPGAPATAR